MTTDHDGPATVHTGRPALDLDAPGPDGRVAVILAAIRDEGDGDDDAAAEAAARSLAHDLAEARQQVADWQRQTEHALARRDEARREVEAEGLAIEAAARDCAVLIRERDEAQHHLRLLWGATGCPRELTVGEVVGAILQLVDTARIARTQLRPQLARTEADAQQLRERVNELESNVPPEWHAAAVQTALGAAKALGVLAVMPGEVLAAIDMLRRDRNAQRARADQLARDLAVLRALLDGTTPAPNTTQPPALEWAMHSVWLHGKWAWLTRNMTTEEREAASDAVDRVGEWLSRSDGEDRQPIERWWRDGPTPNATQPLYVDADGKPTGFPRVEVTADVHIVPAGPASSPTSDQTTPPLPYEETPFAGDDYNGFTLTAHDAIPKGQDAVMRLTRDGALIRMWHYPAYRVWTLLAHWREFDEVNPDQTTPGGHTGGTETQEATDG